MKYLFKKNSLCSFFKLLLGVIISISVNANETSNKTNEKNQFNVPPYQGINHVPAVTMQIHPTPTGDTVANDSEVPPGKGKLIVVGFWQQPDNESSQKTNNPCSGEPHFKIAFPVEYGDDKCYAWKHWDINGKAHENSASRFRCQNGKLEYTQWTTYTCSGGINKEGTLKEASTTQCNQDIPPELYSQIINVQDC